MAETPERLIQGSLSIGDLIAGFVTNVADNGRSYGPESEYNAERIVDIVAEQIDRSDPELESARFRGGADRELGKLLAPFVDRFLKLFHREDFRRIERLPLLRARANELNLSVPIDAGNPRSIESIVARIRTIPFDREIGRNFEFDGRGDAQQWRRIVELIPFVELRPHLEAATNFFSLFTLSFWSARRSVSSSASSATVNFTVDCANHGYQLEYWPQFLFSPVVFGATLTRPVSAVIPVNHYHFQGWIGGTVTPDGGLYVADPNNTAATLRAF